MEEKEELGFNEEEYAAYLLTLPEGEASVLRAIRAIANATELVLEANPNLIPDIVVDWAVVVADIKKLNAYAQSYCIP